MHENGHLCDSLLQFKFDDVVEGIYSFNTIYGAVSMRETNSQKQVSSIEFIKSSDLGKDPFKADVWSRAHKGISAQVSGTCPPLQQRTNIRNRSAHSRPVTELL